MPSHYDDTYHYEYSKPTYDSKQDKLKYQLIREADYTFEKKAPRLPTRDEEIDYIKW
jgi:hypothetical protein